MSISRIDVINLFQGNRVLAIRTRSINLGKETRECPFTLALVEEQVVLVPFIIPHAIEGYRLSVRYTGDKNPFTLVWSVVEQERQHNEGAWQQDQQASRYGWHTGGACERREREREIKSQPCHGRINRGVDPSTVPGAKPKLGTISLS